MKSIGPQKPIIKLFQNTLELLQRVSAGDVKQVPPRVPIILSTHSFDMIGVLGFNSIKLLPETWNGSLLSLFFLFFAGEQELM